MMNRIAALARAVTCAVTTIGALACGADAPVQPSPHSQNISVIPAHVVRLVYTVDIPTSAPAPNQAPRVSMAHAAMSQTGAHEGEAFASLVGLDAIALEVGRIDRSVIGRYIPGRVRLAVDVRVRNRLTRTVLTTPTFPVPPDGVSGLYLFAVLSEAAHDSGSVVTSRNDVTVQAPSHGVVIPSPDWDGLPYDYIRSTFTGCDRFGATCARYERFASPLLPDAVSEWRRVGFDIEPTVQRIRLRVVLATDLANATA